MPTTEELVGCARQGDRAAFAALLEQHEAAALAVAYGVLTNAEAARDASQEAALKAWQRLDDLTEPSRFGPWFCRIVRNTACDHRRQRRPMAPPAAELIRAGGDPAGELLRQERRAHVAAALATLDDITRTVVMMRYFEGLSSKQIGALLELTPASVDMRLNRAREKLRVRLEKTLAIRTQGDRDER